LSGQLIRVGDGELMGKSKKDEKDDKKGKKLKKSKRDCKLKKDRTSKKDRKLKKVPHCPHCKNHCPLNSPRCKKGRAEAKRLGIEAL